MLAGMQDDWGGEPRGADGLDLDIGESMFETLGKLPKSQMGPSAADMSARMDQVTKYSKVEIKEVVVRTYDLGDEQARGQYQLDMEHIMLGVQLRTHALTYKAPPQFVNDNKGPRYIAHMEWVEFRLLEKPVPTVGS